MLRPLLDEEEFVDLWCMERQRPRQSPAEQALANCIYEAVYFIHNRWRPATEVTHLDWVLC